MVYLARQRISRFVRGTPTVFSSFLSDKAGAPVHLKLENLQKTGSFKLRGAANKLLSLSKDEKERGVIAFSTGNHGRAVAYMAQELGIRAVICVSERVPKYRVAFMHQCGAKVIRRGQSQDEAWECAQSLVEQEGLTMVNAFDDPEIIAGQGTIVFEILEDLPEVDTLVVPVSGGGLIAGIGLVLKALNPAAKLVGISMDCAPAMYHSLKAGRPVIVEEKDSLADALLGGIGLENQYTFQMVQQLVDEVVLVSEEEIAEGMFVALDKHRMVVEGAGAVGISVLLKDRIQNLGRKIAVVVSGGFVDVATLVRIARDRDQVSL